MGNCKLLAVRAFLILICIGLVSFASSSLVLAQASDLPHVLWRTITKDRHASTLELLGNGNLVVSRGYWAYEMFSPEGESLLIYPRPEIDPQQHFKIVFLDDGSFVHLKRQSEKSPSGHNLSDMSRESYDGTIIWSLELPEEYSRTTTLAKIDEGILLLASTFDMSSGRRVSIGRQACYSLDGDLLWSREQGEVGEREYMPILGNGNTIIANEGSLKCFDTYGEMLWEHQSWGVRRGFSVMPSGSCYALLKAPERLIKVGSDGEIAWECNITEHATGKLNSMYEYGYVHGGFVAESADGKAYVCDAYGAVT